VRAIWQANNLVRIIPNEENNNPFIFAFLNTKQGQTITKTKLDKELLSAIKEGKYRLVFITGNAGDGKTAFIRQIEGIAENVEKLSNRNGALFTINGIPFQSNYDGSQDEEEKANDRVLGEFFKPFEGLKNYAEASEGRIIAINEGRLVDFL